MLIFYKTEKCKKKGCILKICNVKFSTLALGGIIRYNINLEYTLNSEKTSAGGAAA